MKLPGRFTMSVSPGWTSLSSGFIYQRVMAPALTQGRLNSTPACHRTLVALSTLALLLLLSGFLGPGVVTPFPGSPSEAAAAATAEQAVEQPLIRVGLVSGRSVVEFRGVSGSYELVDSATRLPVARVQRGERWTATKSGPNISLVSEGSQTLVIGGDLILRPVAGEKQPEQDQETPLFRFNNVRYRGSLLIINTSNGLTAVNLLGIEYYLYGVVGREMGYQAPLEALMAQGVISRSYALASLKPASAYDVGADTLSQVYGGYEAEDVPGGQRIRQAVDQTRGQVVYYDGKLARTFFHSNAGGHTESSENVWLERIPYLQAVPSPLDDYALRSPLQAAGWPTNTYAWVKDMSREEVQKAVDTWLGPKDRGAGTNGSGSLGSVQDLRTSSVAGDGSGAPAVTSVSGRAMELKIIGDQGTVSAYKDDIRSVLGLRSTLFNVEMDSSVRVLDRTSQPVLQVNRASDLVAVAAGGRQVNLLQAPGTTYFVQGSGGLVAVPGVFSRVTISGQGFGHGVGLSQWGAQGLAQEKNYNYRQIIEHYYNQGKNDGRLVVGPYQKGQ